MTGIRFDAVLTYVLEGILRGKSRSLFTRRAEKYKRIVIDCHAIRASYTGPLWVDLGGEFCDMLDEYKEAVSEGQCSHCKYPVDLGLLRR